MSEANIRLARAAGALGREAMLRIYEKALARVFEAG